MLIIRRPARPGQAAKPVETEACGVPLSFVLLSYDGADVVACYVPDDHPKVAELAKTYAQIPGHDVVRGARPTATTGQPSGSTLLRLQPSFVVAAVAGDLGAAAAVLDSALRNGWTAADLDGLNPANPGPGGGYSTRAGLTLAQLSLSAPPPGWEQAAATRYPWECEGFRPPGLDWTPPKVPSKTPAPKAPETPATPLEVPPKDPETPIPFDEDPPVVDAKPATGADPAVVAGYPAEHVDAARILAQRLQAEAGGKPVHHNKFNYHARNQDPALPTANESQFAGLLLRSEA